MNSISLIDVIISLFLLTFVFNYIGCDIAVTGRCGRPGVPPKATKHLISNERSKFENKEKVLIMCKKNEFPLIKHDLMCNNGHWTGRQPRCGRHIDANAIHLDIFDCQEGSGHRLLSSQPFNQSAEAPAGYTPLRPNSFHTLRVPEELITSANGSKCYSYKMRFDRKVQIWFLMVDIWVDLDDTKVMPDLTPDLGKYRSCELVKNMSQVMGQITVFGYYFICDLKNVSDVKRDELEMSDTITVKIQTNFTERVGLEAVMIGDIFTDTMGSRVVPECGQMEVQNLGVDAQEEVGHTFISCNDSFVDISGQDIKLRHPNGNPKHMFMCNWNGVWVGQWPVCVPKVTCPEEGLTEEMDSSVMIEELGNVYYFNESKWFAINDSFIRYSCLYENDIMIGKNIRTCLKDGKWNTKPPHCTRAGMSGTSIALIMFAVLIVFVLIVFFVFRTHSRRVNRELRETREEINGSQRKRISEEFYADFKADFYDNTDCVPKTLDYESVDYDSVGEQPRYDMEPGQIATNRPPSPQYLRMLSIN